MTIFVVTMIKEMKTLHTGTRVSDDHYFENLRSRAKFDHRLLFNISYQLPHIWMILMALMSRPSRLNRPNFKSSENRGHLRPFNSHFQMLKCVIIQVVLLFDKVLAFVNISVKYKYYIVRSIYHCCKKLLAWRCHATSLERMLSLILKPIFRLGTNVVSKNLLQVRILDKIS